MIKKNKKRMEDKQTVWHAKDTVIKVAVTRHNVINERDEMHEGGREGEGTRRGVWKVKRGEGRRRRKRKVDAFPPNRVTQTSIYSTRDHIFPAGTCMSHFSYTSEQTPRKKKKKTNKNTANQPCTNKQTRLTGVQR